MSITQFQSVIAAQGVVWSGRLAAGATSGNGGGYIRGSAGTLTPDTIQGYNIEQLRTFTNQFAQEQFNFYVTTPIDLGKDWFQTLKVIPDILTPEYTLTSAASDYIYTAGEARWSWLAGFDSILNGRNYTVDVR